MILEKEKQNKTGQVYFILPFVEAGKEIRGTKLTYEWYPYY